MFSGGSHSLMSPEPPGYSASPVGNKSMEALTEIHSHLVRSPPPIEWPSTPGGGGGRGTKGGGGLLSPRSNDSSDGLEMDYPPGNYYTRCSQ